MNGYYFKQTVLMLIGITVGILLADNFMPRLISRYRDTIESVHHTKVGDGPIVSLMTEEQLVAIAQRPPLERFRSQPFLYLLPACGGMVIGLFLARITGKPHFA